MHTIIKDNVRAYAKADRHGKAIILDAITNLTGMHRKATIRAFNRELKDQKPKTKNGKPNPNYGPSRRRKPGRPRKYDQHIEAALTAIWEDHGYICAERLYSIIKESIRIMKRDGQ